MTRAGRLGIARRTSPPMPARRVPPNRSRASVCATRACRGAARASRLHASSRAVRLVPHRLHLIRGPPAESRSCARAGPWLRAHAGQARSARHAMHLPTGLRPAAPAHKTCAHGHAMSPLAIRVACSSPMHLSPPCAPGRMPWRVGVRRAMGPWACVPGVTATVTWEWRAGMARLGSGGRKRMREAKRALCFAPRTCRTWHSAPLGTRRCWVRTRPFPRRTLRAFFLLLKEQRRPPGPGRPGGHSGRAGCEAVAQDS